MPEVFSCFSHGAVQCRPVLNVRSEDLCRHTPCQLRHKAMKHDRLIAELIGKPSPVEVVGVPAFAEEAARKASEERKWFDRQKIPAIAGVHHRVRYAEV